MALLRRFFPQLRSKERLSSVLPTKAIALLAFAWSAGFLYMWPTSSQWWAIFPFILMATKGVDITVVNGLFLSALWMTYTLLITCPLYVIMGRYFVLLIYLPILGVVFYKQPHEKADPLFLLLESVFWDFPLICWMRLISALGGRALKPFYSQITDKMAVGSMPLETDAKYLHNKQNIGLVVNMCREYAGPLSEYEQLGIRQIHLPTPDVCEPQYESVLKGVREIILFLDEKEKNKIPKKQEDEGGWEMVGSKGKPDGTTPTDDTSASQSNERTIENTEVIKRNKVFIHCKAGRGRAATVALCYLIATSEMQPKDAMRLIKQHRSVVEPGILRSKVVLKFIKRLEHFDWNFETLYIHDYALPTSAD